ncbi:MAG: aminotransferase class I/II-fold pyridoxal phosphate-dependent enzyme [Lachnospiraceae bacterium]|nr:aminotransferase class I/II-fold pyridoxal phosphate-dependent enzyme [Lachnospiraceae bacterium]
MQSIHGGDIYTNKVKFDFSVNVNPLGIPKGVEDALHQAVVHCREYPDIQAFELKEAVAKQLAVPKEYLLFGNGASEVFMGIMHALKPRKVLIPVPSFYGYQYVAEAIESEIRYFSMEKENSFLLGEKLLEALTEDIDVLFLANPNNPTGKRLKCDYLKEVLAICREKGIYVVLDECFISFCEGDVSLVSEIAEYTNLLLVQAFTKLYAIPGVRLGFLISSNKILLQKIARQLPEWNLSVFAQEAGIACVKEKAFVKQTVEYVKKERAFLTEQLQKMGLEVFDGEGNFILVYTEKPLYELLLERGILIRDCQNFKGLTKGYYRIAVKSREENKILLREIGECFA